MRPVRSGRRLPSPALEFGGTTGFRLFFLSSGAGDEKSRKKRKANGDDMRPVKGFEHPTVQWVVLAACVLLTALLMLSTVSVRRSARQVEELLEAQRASRTDQDSLQAQFARERAAREAFSLELARLRAQQPSDGAAPSTPTVTLVSPGTRGALPPDPTITAPERDQTIELRLVLPAAVTGRYAEFQIVARDWSNGRSLWSTTAGTAGTADGRRAVIAHITGEMLRPRAYEVVVTGNSEPSAASEAIAVYEVGVRK